MTDNALFWNGIAEKYARTPVANPAAFDRKIALTKARMRPEHHLLEIGCGTGSLALRLAPSAAQIHGLDISTEMVRIARGKAAAAGVDNVTFHVGPFDDSFTAFAPESFDGICAYSILHLMEDRPAALARMFSLLKPGGFFASSTAVLGESLVPYRPILAVARAFGKAPEVVTVLRKSMLEAEVRAAGFVDVQQPDVGAEPTIAFMLATKPLG
ncbi:MAG: class I SAM-dependent methyltransferase [Sandaracinaceae bacterium]|jgi:arsenite methyltransferase|nr:class I SAM-dependent methyltransferase [Sandaracinaceae bacterium]MBP7680366.1 class I SAM-dependent methyltransferase [Deltaproteobacteria bacterium]MBK6809906.1 class I SAM-dependent methyltransferase [Sandaracinaceae bacterium]MBK7156363.1 class I SAM-dependent methyltransferase [Sandaracinaceae bacterium]MBK8409942.1 class I SAM-dependent methyltransferase [Sandaracinaceae bacterium]